MSDWNQPPGGGEQQPQQPQQPWNQPPQQQPPFGGGGQPGPQFSGPGGSFNLSSWGKRAGGYLVDQVPVVVLYLIGVALIKNIGFIFFLGAIGFSIWNYVFKQGTTGQTIGKGVMQIKLVRESDAQPVGPGLAFGRGLCHIVDSVICYVGFLFPLWDPKRQTIADKICQTVVIDV